MTRFAAVVLTLIALLAVLAGCEKPPANDPAAIGQAFADALAEGDTTTAAGLWDYVVDARKQNEDWDDIPSGQRSQIIGKLRKDKAKEFTQWASYFGEGMTAGTATTQGTTASVVIAGGPQGDVTVYLNQSDGQWGVVGCQP